LPQGLDHRALRTVSLEAILCGLASDTSILKHGACGSSCASLPAQHQAEKVPALAGAMLGEFMHQISASGAVVTDAAIVSVKF
jgi:hypothetical protein